jgi:hypothetical protein
MRTDAVLRQEGMRLLSDKFGPVEAERFVALLIREPFDYTEWQRDLYTDMTLEELCVKADQYWKNTHQR